MEDVCYERDFSGTCNCKHEDHGQLAARPASVDDASRVDECYDRDFDGHCHCKKAQHRPTPSRFI